MPIAIRSGIIQVPQVVVGNFPGQAGNPVGFAAAPGYPGSLTSYGGGDITVSGTAGSPVIYQFKDFANGSSGLAIFASYIRFIGCRFQCSGMTASNVGVNSSLNAAFIEFIYCSFVPLISNATQPPNGGGYTLWPTGGTGLGITPDRIDGSGLPSTELVNICVAQSSGYQYGITCNASPVTCDHCDFWGFANCITTTSTTGLLKFQDCWIHDNRYPGATGTDHTDGIGFLDGNVAPQNVVVDHCTITAEGVEDGLAAQASSNGYTNWTVNNNYFTGWDIAFELFSIPNSNVKITNNIFGTEVPWEASPVSTTTSWFSGSPNGNKWSNNTLKIYPGTSDVSQVTSPKWNSTMNGYFIWPDTNGTYHSTDFA